MPMVHWCPISILTQTCAQQKNASQVRKVYVRRSGCLLVCLFVHRCFLDRPTIVAFYSRLGVWCRPKEEKKGAVFGLVSVCLPTQLCLLASEKGSLALPPSPHSCVHRFTLGKYIRHDTHSCGCSLLSADYPLVCRLGYDDVQLLRLLQVVFCIDVGPLLELVTHC